MLTKAKWNELRALAGEPVREIGRLNSRIFDLYFVTPSGEVWSLRNPGLKPVSERRPKRITPRKSGTIRLQDQHCIGREVSLDALVRHCFGDGSR